MDNKFHLKNVRIAFPKLFKMEQVNGEGKPAYSAAFLLSPDDPQVDAMNTLVDAVATEKWGAKVKPVLAQLRGTDKALVHNGDLKGDLDGYAGMYYVNARAYTQLLVLDRDRTPLVESSGKPYGGCYVDASIEVWAQDNQFGKRVNASLRWVQFRRDGDAFAGGAPATLDEVPEITDEDDSLV